MYLQRVVRLFVWFLLGLACAPGSRSAAQEGKSGRVAILDALEHKDGVREAAFIDGGKTLGSISFAWEITNGGVIQLWDVATRKTVKTITLPKLTYEDPVQPALGGAISPDGKWAAVGQHVREKAGKKGDGFKGETAFTIELYDLATGKKARSIAMDQVYRIGQLKFSPNSKVLALADGHDRGATTKNFAIRFWNASTGKHLGTLSGHTHVVNGIEFSANGEKLASASHDGTVRVWDLTTGEPVHTFEEKQLAWAVAFSPDGKTLAYAVAAKSDVKKGTEYRDPALDKYQTLVKLVDLDSGKVAKTFTNTIANRMTGMAFHKDGKLLAVADYGAHDAAGKIKLWNVDTGKELITLGLHEGSVSRIQFSPDGKTLATAGGNRAVLIDEKQATWQIVRDKTVKLWGIPELPHTFTELKLYNPIFSGN